MDLTCALCPRTDSAYICREHLTPLTRALDLAFAVLNDPANGVAATVARLDRMPERGGLSHPPNHPQSEWTTADGALRPTALPVRLDAATRADAAVNELTGWARHIAEQRGIPPERAASGAATAARYIAVHADWLRWRPEATEAWPAIEQAAKELTRLVDSPPQMQLVGGCDCGQWLYAPASAAVTTCRGCGRTWDVQSGRDAMRAEAEGLLFTAADCARMARMLGYPVTDAAVRGYARHGKLEQRGADRRGHPMYRLGDALNVAARAAA